MKEESSWVALFSKKKGLHYLFFVFIATNPENDMNTFYFRSFAVLAKVLYKFLYRFNNFFSLFTSKILCFFRNLEIELNLVALIDKSLYIITSGLEYFFKNKLTAKCDDIKFFEDFISNTFGLVSFCINYDRNLVTQIYNYPDISKCLKFGNN